MMPQGDTKMLKVGDIITFNALDDILYKVVDNPVNKVYKLKNIKNNYIVVLNFETVKAEYEIFNNGAQHLYN